MIKLILATFVFASLLNSFEWERETVVEGKSIGSFSLAIDEGGNPWILFVSDSTLYVRYKDGTQWKTEVVDDMVYDGASTAISISGDAIWAAAEPYAYHKEMSSWVKTRIDSSVGHLDLVVDPNELPHVCYVTWESEPPYKFLKYATMHNSFWSTEYIETSGVYSQSFFPSIVLDENNNPYAGFAGNIAYNFLVSYAFRDLEGWHIDGFSRECPQTGSKISIALDLEKIPHITYNDCDYFNVNYVSRVDTGWALEVIESGLNSPNVPCQIDPNNGTIYAAYTDNLNMLTLFYAIRADTGWIKKVVDTIRARCNVPWCDMKLDSSGYPHIVYGTDSALYYAVGRPNSGETETKPAAQTSSQLTVSPTPSRPTVHFSFSLPQPGRVALKIYDTSGRCVRTLLTNQNIETGIHAVTWNGRDDFGKAVPPGIYFCRLATENRSVIEKLVLIK